MPLLVAACPSFLPAWNEMQVEQNKKERLYYIELASFASHLIKLKTDSKTEEFSEVFGVIERLHIEGDEYVQEVATVGLLEDIQNIAGNQGLERVVFIPYLHPVSKSWWYALNRFWDGESDRVTLKDVQ